MTPLEKSNITLGITFTLLVLNYKLISPLHIVIPLILYVLYNSFIYLSSNNKIKSIYTKYQVDQNFLNKIIPYTDSLEFMSSKQLKSITQNFENNISNLFNKIESKQYSVKPALSKQLIYVVSTYSDPLINNNKPINDIINIFSIQEWRQFKHAAQIINNKNSLSLSLSPSQSQRHLNCTCNDSALLQRKLHSSS